VLTDRGRDFGPVLTALMAFGNRQFAVEGVASFMADAETGEAADPIVVDRKTGRPIDEHYVYTAGPAAGPDVLARVGQVQARRRAML